MKINNLLITALILSLLIHLSFIYLFVFIIPLINESHKPNIVFLGSILKSSDMLDPDLMKPHVNTSGLSLRIMKQTRNNSPYLNGEDLKPLYKQHMKNDKKLNIKSVFDTSYKPKQQSDNDKFLKKMGEYFSKEEYAPLKLPE